MYEEFHKREEFPRELDARVGRRKDMQHSRRGRGDIKDGCVLSGRMRDNGECAAALPFRAAPDMAGMPLDGCRLSSCDFKHRGMLTCLASCKARLLPANIAGVSCAVLGNDERDWDRGESSPEWVQQEIAPEDTRDESKLHPLSVS